ncbi:hypothetical protein SAMN05421595_0547 [Austwickia chelonae]|uniref:Transglycosylase SLT domain-containing protein n=1 Tax=Austwickia chelonae NBRC 105200 TaxID=1184607 RepID=K6UMD7_9MICO|nr:hypothetical protein [Austwickia chelonae]GAB78031.1 hypothetical protein AUCHE_08_02750 [Austwickia chelonae NBRC 105200]SEV94721.1 hypothetical protein SAMN05421595_0547 [Austwickia chelonae]
MSNYEGSHRGMRRRDVQSRRRAAERIAKQRRGPLVAGAGVVTLFGIGAGVLHAAPNTSGGKALGFASVSQEEPLEPAQPPNRNVAAIYDNGRVRDSYWGMGQAHIGIARQAGQAYQSAAAEKEAKAKAIAKAKADAEAAKAASLARAQADPRSVARTLVAQRGWGPGEFACLDQLWNKESRWQFNATNASSGAYGIPQSLPASKMASAGADWKVNPTTQITWGLGYISGRYGSPCAAWGHSQSHNWY